MSTQNNILAYEPSKAGAGIFGGLYLALAVVFAFHTVKGKAWKEQWGSCLYIGCLCESLRSAF